MQERLKAEAEARQISPMGELTGLFNRRGFLLITAQQLKLTDASHGQNALAVLTRYRAFLMKSAIWLLPISKRRQSMTMSTLKKNPDLIWVKRSIPIIRPTIETARRDCSKICRQQR
jgi:hypothetical protein